MGEGSASWVKSFKNAFSIPKETKAGSEMALPFLSEAFHMLAFNP
jgi:hypothetical protein